MQVAVHTTNSQEEGKFRMAQEKISQGFEEAKGIAAAVLKGVTIIVPAGAAVQLGLIEFLQHVTRQEIVAVAMAILALGMALVWLRR